MCTTYRKEDCGKDVARYALQEKTWWDTRSFLAHVIRDALVQFKNAPRNGYPVSPTGDYSDEVEGVAWEQSLDKMVLAFQLLVAEDNDGLLDPGEYSRIEDGLLEFAAHFRDLWD
jgi:hypothetical protein